MTPRVRLGAVVCATFLGLAAVPGALAQQNAVRPEVGNPLKAAEGMIRSRNARGALAEVAKAEAVANRTPYENLLIQQVKGSAANAAGDYDTAITAFEAVLNSGRVQGSQATELEKAIAVGYYQKKDYAKSAQWSQRYFKEGGSDGAIRQMLVQSYYLSNDCAAVGKMVNGEKAKEDELQMLLNCYQREKDTAGYVATMEKLVMAYPKKEYWTDLLARVQKKPGFSDRLALHVYRLRFATNNFTGTNDYFEMAQLAIQAGLPAEAKSVVDKGYEVKALGTGKEAERHQRLRDLITKSLAEAQKSAAANEQDPNAAGDDLVKVGLNYVFAGQGEKGIGIVEKGIKKGGLKRPEDAKLSLGEAQIIAGQRSRGAQTLKGVQGADGTADMARLWSLYARG